MSSIVNQSGVLHHYDEQKKKWCKRFFLLTETHLKYFKDQNQTQLKGDLLLTKDSIVDQIIDDNNDFAFTLISPVCNNNKVKTKLMKLFAKDEFDLITWMEVCMAQHFAFYSMSQLNDLHLLSYKALQIKITNCKADILCGYVTKRGQNTYASFSSIFDP